METNDTINSAPKNHSWILGGLAAGMVIALAGNGYLLMRSNDLNDEIARNQNGAQTEMSRMNEENLKLRAMHQQKTEELAQQLKTANESTAAAVRRARAESQKQSAEIISTLDNKLTENQNQFNGAISQLSDTTTNKITEVNGNVDQVKTNYDQVKTTVEGVKADVATNQSEIAKTNADLKRAVGDMGVMSGLIATNGTELAELRALGERNYFEFDITKKAGLHRVGDINIQLKKSDAKRNRYTLEVVADDKHVEKKDKTINEPVQLYVGGSKQPYEIVVNQVSKDRAVGYLSTPKVKMARR